MEQLFILINGVGLILNKIMILLTGSSGFLGSEILKALNKKKITSLSRSNSDYNFDLSISVPIFNNNFDTIIHAAGLAHIENPSILENNLFYQINVAGTNNLLKGLELIKIPKHFIFISSIAVYGLDSGENIKEDFPLLATDPYGQSKIYAEKLITEWCHHNNVLCTILRLPIIIGSNAPGNLRSIINAIKKGYYFNIIGNNAKKSMVLSYDIANFFKIIPNSPGIFNLTDGYNPSIIELTNLISLQLGLSKPSSLPPQLFKILAFIGDNLTYKFPFNSNKFSKLTNTLTFDDSKARNILNWNSNQVLKTFKL